MFYSIMDVNIVSADELANGLLDIAYSGDSLLVIDTRSMLEFNGNHVQTAVNLTCSKLIKHRLQNNQINVCQLLETINCDWSSYKKVLIYDQSAWDVFNIPHSHLLYVLVEKMMHCFPHVAVLQGGFTEFAYKYPKLCESKRKAGCALLSISTPCASTDPCPPTKVLPFLYLGSEKDAQSEDVLRTCRVKYVLNASQTAADTPYCSLGHYLRIPIQDNSNENIVSWFQTAFDFIDKVKESDDHVLLHCVGGVSRSATIAIAYVMRHLSLSLDNAYRYVKEKRPTISPNLNFMGQLLQYEQELLKETELICTPLSDLKLEGLKSPSSEFQRDTYLFTGNEKFISCGAFPSPDSDDITPSSTSTEFLPSPVSDDMPSPSRHEFVNSSESVSAKPFTLDINFTKKDSCKSKGFTLQLDCGKT